MVRYAANLDGDCGLPFSIAIVYAPVRVLLVLHELRAPVWRERQGMQTPTTQKVYAEGRVVTDSLPDSPASSCVAGVR